MLLAWRSEATPRSAPEYLCPPFHFKAGTLTEQQIPGHPRGTTARPQGTEACCAVVPNRLEPAAALCWSPPPEYIWFGVSSSTRRGPQHRNQLASSNSLALRHHLSCVLHDSEHAAQATHASSHRLFDVGLSRGSSTAPLLNTFFRIDRPPFFLQLRPRQPSPWIQWSTCCHRPALNE